MKFMVNERLSRVRPRTILLVVILSLVFLGCVLGASFKYWYEDNVKPLSQQASEILVTIPQGHTTNQIADLLQAKGVIKSAAAFEWYILFSNLRNNLQAGEYILSPSYSVEQIANKIVDGQINTKKLTILPAKRLDQIKTAFADSGYDQSEIEAAFNPALYANHPALEYKPAEASLEGYLYPETFHKMSSTPATEIIRKSLDQMDLALTDDIVNRFQQQGLSVHEGIILASIVEQEAPSFEDRKIIASVFLNRLKQGMVLGSDVTYHYAAAITGQEPTPFIDSPYNTRMYSGLPPGPIGNVSSGSLEAVANPAVTDYLFFVAGDPVDGVSEVYYSKTQAEHEALARQYCHELCSTY